MDGFRWERFPGEKPFLDNGAPGSWSGGLIIMQSNAVEVNGKTLFLLSRGRNIFHFCGVFLAGYTDHNAITGELVKKKLKPLGIEKWPYFKQFNGYDGLAEFMRGARSESAWWRCAKDGYSR